MMQLFCNLKKFAPLENIEIVNRKYPEGFDKSLYTLQVNYGTQQEASA